MTLLLLLSPTMTLPLIDSGVWNQDPVSLYDVPGTGAGIGPPQLLNVTGTFGATLGDVSMVAAGTETISGTFTPTLSGCTMADVGTETISGTFASTLSAATMSAVATEAFSGALASTLADVTMAASGYAVTNGTFIVTLAGTTMSADGYSYHPILPPWMLHGGGKLRRGYPRQHQHLERLR